MGASESKTGSAQVWKASGPNGVSQDIVESFQSSHETDASRARLIELQIQRRVADELKKMHKKESETLSLAHEKLSTAPDMTDKTPTQYTVSKEVEELRHKLEERRQLRQLPESLEGSRGKLIQCLRENDRRPLDCWQEVEDFKAEVKKLEMSWVDKKVS